MPEDLNTGGTPSAAPASTPSPATAGAPPSADRPYFDPSLHVEKSEFTRLRQRDAQERQHAEQASRQREEQLVERERQILQAATILQQRLAQGQPTQDPYSKLRELSYVPGETLAEQLESLRRNDIGGLQNELKRRDQAIQLLHKQLQATQQAIQTMQGRSVESDFSSRLDSVRGQLGLPQEEWATEFLKDIYLSHQGDDLNDQFPNMARSRFDALRKALREIDKAEAAKARALPTLPGGGSGTPSQRLKEGYKTPDQLAEAFYSDSKGGDSF